jgi:hypothetical protein
MNEPENVGHAMRRIPVVLLGAFLLCWPAIYNHYPLLYPDSISYLGDGHSIAYSLFVRRIPNFSGMRSEIYSVGIFPWHWNITPWGVVALQALTMAAVLWLVVRSILPRNTGFYFLGLIALLSLLTSVSWYVSLIMPDGFGAALYLCIYLLVFARETLSGLEHWAVAVIAWWSVTAHATHLLLAAGICLLLAVLLGFRWRPMLRRGRAVGEVALVVLLAAGAQVALHAYLYGEASLNGNRPPYLMARVIADGPGRLYLQQHCGQLHWAICDRVRDLPDNDDEFLWADGGVWPSASPAAQARLLEEEMPLVRATLRAYPREQIAASGRNFWQQLSDFGVDDFDNNTWMEGALDQVMPGAHAKYLRSRQAHDAVPSRLFTEVQWWVVMASALVVVASMPWLWRRGPTRLVGLTMILVPTIVANALVTAVLSTIDSRYQSRVIWLVPLLAGLLAMKAVDEWGRFGAGIERARGL